MGLGLSLTAVIALILLVFAGVKGANLHLLFGAVIPYAAFIIFTIGVIYRVVKWGRSPVPFRIPTTGGQENSFPWIKQNKFDNPSTTSGVIVRMLLEVFAFRSLFRLTKSELKDGKLVHGSDKWLWLAGLAFHWCFLIILIRHLRFFTQNVPFVIQLFEALDAFFQVGVPLLYLTDIFLVGAVTYLFLRRVVFPQVKYISLAADYFPLLLILSIAVTGILMRYFIRVDIVGVKQLTMGLVTFSPVASESIGVIFYIHVFLVSVLFAYFPFSKLMHMGGVLLSPTRNLANNNRMVRHINPWDYPVHVHTYEEYENDFREKMKKAGIPVEKE
ncbi:MAG: menaquinol oxidoreductase [Thermodesulfovibrio sp.]|nr:menaquinol oxidoreductase [Thermodesulfovibrio sp.]